MNVKSRSDWPQAYPRVGVSVAVFRENAVLLVQRREPPFQGRWSLPGGGVHWGEEAAAAARRELEEETGLRAAHLVLADVADAIVRDYQGTVEAHYTIVVFATDEVSGTLAASTDALDARWFDADAVRHLDRTPGLELAVENARLALDKSKR